LKASDPNVVLGESNVIDVGAAPPKTLKSATALYDKVVGITLIGTKN
jgi:hypothetical protein